MNSPIFTAVQNDTELNDRAQLEQHCFKLLNQYGHLIFLLDSTLNPSIFDDVVNVLAKKNIAYIPLAIKKDMATSDLFLICIDDHKVFEQVKDDLLQNLICNKDIVNDSYFVHGFGTTKIESLEELRDQIRNKLVVSDQGRKILFRWYDPRVLIYLNDILEEKNLVSLVDNFEAWHFLHPTGFYSIESSEERTQIKKVPLRSLNKAESIALDLVELSNSVFQQLNDFNEVDISQLHPVNIHKTLLQAHNHYGLENNLDLVTYGLYGQIIHQDFMAHSLVTDILYEHCVQGELSFTDAMDYLDSELYSVIQQDLNVSGALEWAGYLVTPKGHLSYFPVGKVAPKSVPEFACKGVGHNFNSSVISVESNPKDEAKIAYIIHTHVPMSKAKLSEYEKNAEKFVTEGKWQKVLISAGNTQEHCIAAGQFKTTVYNINSFGENRINATLNKFKNEPKSLACMALYDPVGITRKLNSLRNSEFKSVMEYLAKKEGAFTNEHRLHSSQCIDSIKICLENRLLSEKNQLSAQLTKNAILRSLMNELPKNLTDADDINYELEKIYKRKSKEEQERLLREAQKKQDPTKGIFNQDMGTLSKDQGAQIWNKKYKINLDVDAKSKFDTTVNELIEKGLKGARAVADDHIKWLLSKAVINALHAYDDQVQVPYGSIFYVHAMDMINGMSGVPSGQALLETWLGVEKIAKENIYMRAICYNQESLKNKYNTAAPSIIDISWDDGQNATKTVIAAFVAADKAWQEWAADKTNNGYMLHGQKFSLLKTFYWMSELTQSAVKWSMKYTPGSEFAKKLGRLTFYTFAHSGALVEHVAKNSLYYLIPVHTLTGRIKLTPEMVQNNWKKYSSAATNPSKAAKQIDRIIANSSPSAGLRVSGVVAIFELINFGTQVSKFNNDPSVDNALSYMSGMMATTAAILEVGSSSMEKFSFAERAAYIAKCGAYFAIAGATVSLIIDVKGFVKSKNEGNPYAIALSGLKVLNSLFTFGVGFNALLNLPLMKNSSLYHSIDRYVLGRAFLGISAIRVGAILSVAGIALVILEIYLKNYVLDNAMQDWCQKCAFRLKTSAESPFKDIKEEEKEFNSAVVSV